MTTKKSKQKKQTNQKKKAHTGYRTEAAKEGNNFAASQLHGYCYVMLGLADMGGAGNAVERQPHTAVEGRTTNGVTTIQHSLTKRTPLPAHLSNDVCVNLATANTPHTTKPHAALISGHDGNWSGRQPTSKLLMRGTPSAAAPGRSSLGSST